MAFVGSFKGHLKCTCDTIEQINGGIYTFEGSQNHLWHEASQLEAF